MEDKNVCYIDEREDGLSLSGKWNFNFYSENTEAVPETESLPYCCKIPSSVYFNMYDAGLLPHPYNDTNSKLFRNLDEKVWYFGRKFTVPSNKKGKKVFLCADGISYYSTVWINGAEVVSHEGMYGGPNAEITDFIKYDGENEIIIRTLAPNYGKKEGYSFWNNEGKNREIVPWNLMHDNATSNGDFTVVGIWNKIRLEFLSECHLARPYFYTEKISADGKTALIRFETEISTGEAPVLHEFYGRREGTFETAPGGGIRKVYTGEKVKIKITLTEKKTGKVAFSAEEMVKLLDMGKSMGGTTLTENQFYEKRITIKNPLIWNPLSEEKADLYRAEVTLEKDGKILDTQKLNAGIRTVTTEKSVGQKYRTYWQDWQFRVNGKKVFIKGMNWTPIDYLYDISPDKYRTYLEMIKNAGCNIVRVWSGGGMPETETFYDICDELGLMVWQDHFPANTQSTQGWPMDVLESQEALNIYRIRKHPSLVLHCGGNEINPYTDGNAKAVLTVARLSKVLDPTRIFHQAALDMGSAHIYGDFEPVWYGKRFQDLPFLGESGIHSFPSYKTLSQVLSGNILTERFDLSCPENLGKDPGLLNHFSEFSPERVPRMLSRASQMTNLSDTTLENISLATQTACHEFYGIMLESMRHNYPVTTGAMPWVFKRPWPTVGVQLVDGYGRPLMQYYAIKNAFAPTAVMIKVPELTFCPGEAFKGEALIQKDCLGKLTGEEILTVTVYGPDLRKDMEMSAEPGKRSMKIFYQIPETYGESFFFVTVKLCRNGETLARRTYCPKITSKLSDAKTRRKFRQTFSPNLYFEKGPWMIDGLKNAEKAEITYSVKQENEETYVEMKNVSKVPSLFTEIVYDGGDEILIFSDNFFLLEPGEEKRVKCSLVRGNIIPDPKKIHVTSFNSKK